MVVPSIYPPFETHVIYIEHPRNGDSHFRKVKIY
jgi:hypothetical protein